MKLIHINKTYYNKNNKVHALKDINLDLSQNGITMILGPSGCGKTTLLNIMANRETYEGTIESTSNFDYLTQDFNLFDEMSVLDNLLLVSHDKELILQYLNEFSLSLEKDRKVKKLSNGEKKRVQFIRALLHKPGLILCDEPTAALDHENIVLLMEEMKKISEDVQIVMVTHDIALAEQYGDRIITLDQGRVIKDEIIKGKKASVSGQKIKKKNLLETCNVVWKEITSRISDSLVTVLLMILCITTAFTVFNLQANVSSQSDYQSIFKKAENMVVSVPQEQSKDTGESFSGYTMKYSGLNVDDLFDYNDINQLIQDTPEIIGVESWNSAQYLDGDGELEYLRSEYDMEAYHTFTVDGVTRADGSLMEQADYPIEQPYMVSNDSEIYKNMQEYVAATRGNVSKAYPEYVVSVFDIVNDYAKLPLLCGTYPKEDEVLLDRNAADMYMELNGKDNYEDLVGETLSLDVLSYRNIYCNEIENITWADRITMKIAGVSGVENDFTTMIFCNNGYGENPIYKHYVTNIQSMKTDYVRFLLEPGSDYEAIASKINEYFAKDNVVLTQFKGKGLGKDQQFYASPEGFTIYGIVILGILIVMTIVMLVLKRRRLCKEKYILQSYGYKASVESLLRNVLLAVVACIITFILIVPFINFVNSFATANYYQPFMSLHVGMLLIIALITFIVMYVLEICVKGKGNNVKN